MISFIFDFLKHTWRHIRDGDLRTLVYALSFVTLLSLVPFLVITLGLFKWSGFLNFLYPKAKALILANFSGAVGDGIITPFESLLKRSYSGSLGVVNFIFLFITIISLTDYLEKAINRIWQIKNSRNILNKVFIHWLIIFLFPVALALNLVVHSFLLPFFDGIPLLLKALPIPFLTFALFSLFKWLPNCKVQTWSALSAAIVSACGLVFLQSSFSFITKKFFAYSKLYGSLATLPLFMLWISSVWFVILFGASISVNLQKAARGAPSKYH